MSLPIAKEVDIYVIPDFDDDIKESESVNVENTYIDDMSDTLMYEHDGYDGYQQYHTASNSNGSGSNGSLILPSAPILDEPYDESDEQKENVLPVLSLQASTKKYIGIIDDYSSKGTRIYISHKSNEIKRLIIPHIIKNYYSYIKNPHLNTEQDIINYSQFELIFNELRIPNTLLENLNNLFSEYRFRVPRKYWDRFLMLKTQIPYCSFSICKISDNHNQTRILYTNNKYAFISIMNPDNLLYTRPLDGNMRRDMSWC